MKGGYPATVNAFNSSPVQQLGVLADRISQLRARIDGSTATIKELRTGLSEAPPHGPLARDHIARLHQETVRLHTLIEAWELVTHSKWHD